MKNTLYKILGLFFVILLWSCQKDTENISRITYFPTFDFKGASVVLQALGAAYVDPGTTATEDGKNLPVTLSVTGLTTGYKGNVVKTDVADKYSIVYTALNSDSFPGTRTRDVWVAKTGDLVNSIEGLYSSTVFRNNVSGAQYTNMKYILISKKSANQYAISCGIGGWYLIGRALGAAYAAPTTITANNIAANNFTFADFVVGGFGGPAKITSLTVDPATKTLILKSEWSSGNDGNYNYKFVSTLKQVQI